MKVLAVCWHGNLKSLNLAKMLVSNDIGAMYLQDGFEPLVDQHERRLLENSVTLNLLSQFTTLALVMSDFAADAPSTTYTLKKFPNLARYCDEYIAYSELISVYQREK